MKKFGLTIGALVIGASVALGSSFNANAAGSAKDPITEVENKIITATSANEVMKYYDSQDVDVYDFVPPLQYKGASAVHRDFDNFFRMPRTSKVNSSSW